MSTIFWYTSTYAQTTTLNEDEQWMKERIQRIHSRYRASGDHDYLLHKLQLAQQNAVSPETRRALAQIIVWWEELRPKTTRSGVSSIPVDTIAPSPATATWVVSTWATDTKTDKEPVLQTGVTEWRYQLDAQKYINIGELQTTWLGWVNDLRAKRGRQAYTLEPLLHKTAADRSETMKNKWVGDHRRFATSPYYAYGEIEQRFADRGVTFVNISRATFTENIGRATFRCKTTDCTQTAIDAMRQTWNFYLREEWTTNDAHRRTLIHPLFTIVGLGIAVDESAGKFYLTTHYGTKLK